MGSTFDCSYLSQRFSGKLYKDLKVYGIVAIPVNTIINVLTDFFVTMRNSTRTRKAQRLSDQEKEQTNLCFRTIAGAAKS